jgi:hypothetical protein
MRFVRGVAGGKEKARSVRKFLGTTAAVAGRMKQRLVKANVRTFGWKSGTNGWVGLNDYR